MEDISDLKEKKNLLLPSLENTWRKKKKSAIAYTVIQGLKLNFLIYIDIYLYFLNNCLLSTSLNMQTQNYVNYFVF